MDFNLEELKTQLGSEVLSESITDDTLIKIKLMAESFVTAKTTELKEQLDEKVAEAILIKEKATEWAAIVESQTDEYVNEIKEKAQAYGDYIKEQVTKEMSEKVESYAEYVVEEFVKENSEQFVEQSEYKKMQKVFSTIKESFEANMFPLNEDSQANQLTDKLQESKDAYSKLFKENQNLKKYATYVERTQILEQLADGLSDTQKEKIERLTESFTDIDQYKTSINILVSDFKNKTTDVVTEQTTVVSKPVMITEEKVVADDMKAFVDYMAKTVTV